MSERFEFTSRRSMPVMALRGLSVFPGMLLNFDVERPMSAAALNLAMNADQIIFLAAQKEISKDVPFLDDIYRVGTVCRVRQLLRQPGSKTVRIMVEGLARGRLDALTMDSPSLFGEIEPMPDAEEKPTVKTEALCRRCTALFSEYAQISGNIAPESVINIMANTDAAYVADFIAQNITVNAVYTPIVYNVTYIVEGEYDVDVPVNDNPVTYTIEDETVILQAPSKTGYNFVKWTENGEEVTEIAAGSYGNKTITAQWEAIVYNIEYKDAPINTNVTSYTVETLGGADGSITLAEPTKTEILSYESNLDGSVEVKREAYTFLGWYSDENYENKVTSITLGLTTLYAKWSLTTTTTEPYVRDGDTVYFGSYPQTRVTDTATTSALGGFDSSTWTSYGYYAGGSVSDYMYYIDKEYNGERYRGVYFTSYRPYSCSSSSSARYSYQDDNGYSTSTVYWFKYEPIAWTVVNEEGGKATLVADLILDSQQYDYENGSYSNNYAESTIRAWLNDTFYNTAFNDLQKAIIQTTEVDNSATSTGYSSNPYACENTYDRIFLMSYVEASTWFTSAAARQRQGSDYAKCQGLYVSTSSSYAGNSCLWLRSPNYDSYSARYVNYYGYFDYNYVYDTNGGVLPALVIEL